MGTEPSTTAMKIDAKVTYTAAITASPKIPFDAGRICTHCYVQKYMHGVCLDIYPATMSLWKSLWLRISLPFIDIRRFAFCFLHTNFYTGYQASYLWEVQRP